MRAIVIAVAIMAGAANAAMADDLMANYYGNTVVTKSPNGESHSHDKKDGTMDAVLSGPMGSVTLTGTWRVDASGELCRTYANVPAMLPIQNPLCTPWATHKVGDTWTITIGGQSRSASLVQGIQ